MKGEGKMVFKSKLKWVGLVGLVLSAFSIFTHFLLARYTEQGISEFQASITIFSWRPLFENADLSTNSPLYRRLWGPGRQLEYIYPHANPRGNYNAAPVVQTNGFVFVRIRGGFHEIRNSICDVVVISRLLNATLVIPVIQSTTSSKGISSEFKSFAYLYDEDQFIAALAKDVTIVKTLPKNLKGARRKKEIPMFRVPYSASPYFYLRHVLPVLNKHSVVELVISDGGCLQAILPHHLEEYQRLRCRVSFHALRFRQEVQELATKILNRLRAPGRPFIAYYPGMTRDALAYYGCAELFQDVHTELIQHRRSWMIKRGIVKGKLSVNSAEQHLNGSCPLMPEEVGILLRAYGYSWDTIIYVSGGEIFGGQKKLIPLHGMFENVVDRTSLSTAWELSGIYGHEANLVDKYPRTRSFVKEETKLEAWKTSGPRPRPLPPPPARPKYPYNIEGWWGWVAESDNEPESTVMELRMTAHKLLWEAIDYTICVEADVFVPGFDRDGKGRPNFASLVMGHRLYQSAASKTYRLDRRSGLKNWSRLEMVRSVKSHHHEDEELVPRRATDCSSQIDGKSTDQKTNAVRSKHSETEQRRRSKINERFQILRDLIPQNDQKRDKASFLLEVIQYIQFLQEKLQMYEGSYQGWSQEPTKLMPWRNNCGPVESFIDQSQLMRNGSGQEDSIVVTPAMLTNAQNSVESDLGEAAVYKALDNPAVAENQAIPINIPLQSSVLGDVPTQPCQAFVSDSEHLASQSQSQFWQSRPCTTESAVPSYTLNEEELKIESGEASISNAYSQGLLNSLTEALQSSGVDLTQASISVQLDVGKRANTGLTATMFSAKDHQNQCPVSQSRTVYGVGSSCEDSDQAHKRLRTEHI